MPRRPPLQSTALAAEQGGLSGRPIRKQSDHVLAVLVAALDRKIPVIAVGGIMSAADAQAKIQAGAALVQLYTGFIYSGPRLVTAAAEKIATH